MKKIYLYLLLLFSVPLLFTQCKKNDQSGDDNSPPPTGTVTGRVVAANNVTPISLAKVFIDAGGTTYATQTNTSGEFSLNAPAGLQKLYIQTGNGHIFRTVMDVTVKVNETVTLPGASVTLNQVANLAYIKGDYDRIEKILVDSLGYTATEIQHSHLSNINNIAQFDAIFINCTGAQPPLFDQPLSNYIANGGSLYVSDYAVRYLVGNYNYTGPCTTVRPGGFLPDSLLCVHQSGNVMNIPTAPVVSPPLQAYLNKNNIFVSFNLNSWEKVYQYNSAFWEVMVTDNQNNPLLVRTHQYSDNSRGTVNIGSPNNNNWVTICHKPNGSNPITITIPQNALAAHLAHGDVVGPCDNEDGSGQIYYTTFHNAHNGGIAPDVKNILQFMILNL